MSEVIALSKGRAGRAAQAWELAGIDAPTTIADAARVAARCLSGAKTKAALVEKHAPSGLKRAASLNFIAQILDFGTWRHLQTFAKQFHTLDPGEWVTGKMTIKLVSALWVLTADQERLGIAKSVLQRTPTPPFQGASDQTLRSLVRIAMCMPERAAADANEWPDDEAPDQSSLKFSRTHYIPGFVARIGTGIDPEPLKRSALAMLSADAPTLPPQVAHDLIEFCLGGPLTKALRDHEKWRWPKAPRSDWHLWGSAHLDAARRAEELSELLQWDVKTWILNAEMADLRRWQGAYLAGPKERSRYGIYWRFVQKFNQEKEVPADLLAEAKAWVARVGRERDLEIEKSKLPPVPHHLRHLADRVFIRLDALFELNDTADRDRAMKQSESILAASAVRSTKVPSAQELADELSIPDFPAGDPFVASRSEVEACIDRLVIDVQALLNSRPSLLKFLSRKKLDTPIVGTRCDVCRDARRPVTERSLPPYRLHCWCRDISWRSSEQMRLEERDYHDTFGPHSSAHSRYQTKAMWWLLHRVLNTDETLENPAVEIMCLARDRR